MIRKLILTIFLSMQSDHVLSDCEKMVRPHYDGGLMVFEERNNSIRIYDGSYKSRLTDKDILWEWRVSEAKNDNFRKRFSKTKNDAKPVMYRGELHLLVVSSRGDGLGLIHFDSGELVYYRRVLGSVHSATITGRDNILLADSKGFLRILSTRNGKTSHCPLTSAHGVVYDKKQDLAWAWGGGGRMVGYRLEGSRENPRLNCRRIIPFFGGPKGGNDLQPMLDGNGMLMGSAGSDIFFFEPDLEWPGRRWGFLQKYSYATGITGVSRNAKTGETVYVRNDRSNDFKLRSNVIRSLDGKTRTVMGKTGFYKVRWFQKNCFSW